MMMNMMMIDHYRVLGLPSGEKGRKLTDWEIRKAYKIRALKLHPDKSKSDPNAVVKFQKLKSSYEFLSNEKNRRVFDNYLSLVRTWRQLDEEEEARRERERKAAEEAEASSFWSRVDEEVVGIKAKFEEVAAKSASDYYLERKIKIEQTSDDGFIRFC